MDTGKTLLVHMPVPGHRDFSGYVCEGVVEDGGHYRITGPVWKYGKSFAKYRDGIKYTGNDFVSPVSDDAVRRDLERRLNEGAEYDNVDFSSAAWHG